MNTRSSNPSTDAAAADALAPGEYRVCPLTKRDLGREWVVPNALGGFAMGTISATPERRYHSILTVSLHPPVMRMNMVAAIDELLIIELPGGPLSVRLTPMRFVGAEPRESVCIRFEKTPCGCVWVYEVHAGTTRVVVRKALQVADGINSARVCYAIESDLDCRMEIRPLLAMRDFHGLNTPGMIASEDLVCSQTDERARIDRSGLAMTIANAGCVSRKEGSIWRAFAYAHEQDRGLDFTEDLYCPLVFEADGDCSIEFALDASGPVEWDANRATKESRIGAMVEAAISNATGLASSPMDDQIRGAIAGLAAAADDFIVRRDHKSQSSSSVIAGYPWFSDWGRDSMISLPGLFLVTGRVDEALGVLRTFADAQRDGLIPNRFDDREGEAHYNTVDASLWFVHACAQYARQTGDFESFHTHLLEPCIEVIEAYRRGARFQIGVDPSDMLVAAGNEHTQLTWMDAQRGGVTFTPRHGKCIEINGLWINALDQIGSIIQATDPNRAEKYRSWSDDARGSIRSLMTDGQEGLVDCLTPENLARVMTWVRSREVRPNQLFVCALGIELGDEIGRAVVGVAENQLLTPAGMRTLSPNAQAYCPIYSGPLMDRDRAYHNGTVWPWLLGAMCESDMRVHGFDEHSRRRTIERVCSLAEEMKTGSVGSLAEIYDAEPGQDGKHAQRGCPAQAWSIAELLRVLVMAAD